MFFLHEFIIYLSNFQKKMNFLSFYYNIVYIKADGVFLIDFKKKNPEKFPCFHHQARKQRKKEKNSPTMFQ